MECINWFIEGYKKLTGWRNTGTDLLFHDYIFLISLNLKEGFSSLMSKI